MIICLFLEVLQQILAKAHNIAYCLSDYQIRPGWNGAGSRASHTVQRYGERWRGTEREGESPGELGISKGGVPNVYLSMFLRSLHDKFWRFTSTLSDYAATSVMFCLRSRSHPKP